MRKAMVLGVLGLSGTLASPAFAEDFVSGWRVGMFMNQDLLEGEFGFEGLGVDANNSNRFGYGLFGGWAPNRYFAIEVGYHGGTEFTNDVFPEALPSISVPPPVTDPVTPDSPPFFVVRNNIKSIDASAVGSLWIGDSFAFFGRLGMMAWKGETSYSYGDADAGFKTVDEVDETDFAPFGGIGIQTVLDRALVRLEYQYFEIGDGPVGDYFGQFDNTMTSVSASIVWTFR